jgi:hypothetical protein
MKNAFLKLFSSFILWKNLSDTACTDFVYATFQETRKKKLFVSPKKII